MTLGNIFLRYKGRISVTMILVIVEAVLFVLFPLYIGFSIDGLIQGNYIPLYQLAGLGGLATIIGGARRFYDTRVYSKIYAELSTEVINKGDDKTASVLTARVNMLSELTAFFEQSFPQIIDALIGLIGTIIILYTFNFSIFLACIGMILFIILIFGITSKRTVRYNHHYNNTLEEQVHVIEQKKPEIVFPFMRRLVKWNIKLSDLETVNFSFLWLSFTALLVYSIYVMVDHSDGSVGAVSSVVMYVYQFAEVAIMLPFFYQQWLRLGEISTRLSK